MVMVFVSEGEFQMGSVADANNPVNSNEMPQHTVFLSAFWLDQTEVTNAMFTLFVTETGYQTEAEKENQSIVFDPVTETWNSVPGANWQHPRGPDSDLSGLETHPVVQVSWNDANAYCAWAGRRLPTEAEWEKAARDNDGRIFPWGNDPVAGNLLNMADVTLNTSFIDANINDGFQFTAPVGSYPDGASPYDALDLAGNVWEWVNDWYDAGYYAISPAENPGGPDTGAEKVLRGGAWDNTGSGSAARNYVTPTARNMNVGFRCAALP
jgi:formylglycine-generating enzyme required for sulfatase activity